MTVTKFIDFVRSVCAKDVKIDKKLQYGVASRAGNALVVERPDLMGYDFASMLYCQGNVGFPRMYQQIIGTIQQYFKDNLNLKFCVVAIFFFFFCICGSCLLNSVFLACMRQEQVEIHLQIANARQENAPKERSSHCLFCGMQMG